MTNERFHVLVDKALNHPLLPFRFTRLLLALRAAVDAHPDAEKAFEAYCADRIQHDQPGPAVEHADLHALVATAEQRAGGVISGTTPATEAAGPPGKVAGEMLLLELPAKPESQRPWIPWALACALFLVNLWQAVTHAVAREELRKDEALIQLANEYLSKPVRSGCVFVEYSVSGSEWREQTARESFPRLIRLRNVCTGLAVGVGGFDQSGLGSIPTPPPPEGHQ